MKPTHKDLFRLMKVIDKKINLLLAHNKIDFSKEDAIVKQMTQKVDDAIDKVPHPEQNN